MNAADKNVTVGIEIPGRGPFATANASELKRKTVRGGVVTLGSQGLRFGLQTGSMMILARILSPEDFGLQGMAAAITGFFAVFKDVGLGAATVQRDSITHEQTSTLFWINLACGLGLTILTAALAPFIAAFYHEPRLFWVTIFSGSIFLLNGLSAQHMALLYREMRFFSIAKIDVISLVASSVVGIAMAAFGCRYWALVGMAVSPSLVGVAGAWLAVRWVPGWPTRRCGIRSMLHFGGALTLNHIVVYLGYNAEKILLGRYWGAAVLGLYGRAYSLANLPTTQLLGSVSAVAFPTLARLQFEPRRLANAFLKGYSIVLALLVPVTVCCMLFAEDIIRIALGAKWTGAVPIFRLLGPTVLAFGLINPFGSFLIATGQTGRSLKIALVIAPLVVLGIALGLRYGPTGVALAYSTVMVLLVIPLTAWAKHGSEITAADLWRTVRPAFVSGLVAALASLAMQSIFGRIAPPLPRLIAELGWFLGIYGAAVLFAMGQKDFYVDLIGQFLARKELGS